MKKIKLSFECYVRDENQIWVAAFDHNGLYKIDTIRDRVEFVGLFPDEKIYIYRLYSSMVKTDNKIFFVPFFASEIAIYDVIENKFQKIKLRAADSFGYKSYVSELCKFWSSTIYENRLYMFPHNYPAMVIMNLDTLELEYISGFIDILEKLRINGEPYFTDLFQEGIMAYCSCACANAYAVIDLKRKSVFIHNLTTNANGFNGILKVDEKLWLAPRVNGALLCYDMKTSQIDQYHEYPLGFTAPVVPFHSIYKLGEGLLLIPALGNQFIYLDRKMEMKNLDILSELICIEKENGIYSFDRTMAYSVDGNQLIFMNGRDYKIYIYDLEGHELKSKTYWIENDYPKYELLPLGRITYSTEVLFQESAEVGLLDFLHLIYAYEENNEYVTDNQGYTSRGRIIYEQIIEDIQ